MNSKNPIYLAISFAIHMVFLMILMIVAAVESKPEIPPPAPRIVEFYSLNEETARPSASATTEEQYAPEVSEEEAEPEIEETPEPEPEPEPEPVIEPEPEPEPEPETVEPPPVELEEEKKEEPKPEPKPKPETKKPKVDLTRKRGTPKPLDSDKIIEALEELESEMTSTDFSSSSVGTASVATGSYRDLIYSKFRRAWRTPSGSQYIGDSVTLQIEVASSGKILSKRIVERNGDPVVVQSAQRAMEQVTFIEPFPPSMRGEDKKFFKVRLVITEE